MRRSLALIVATGVFFLVLVQPTDPAAYTWAALRFLPLELPAVLLGLLALRPAGKASVAVRSGLVALLATLAVLKTADTAMMFAYGRPFNPVVDFPLVGAGWHLAKTTLGMAGAIGAGGLACAVIAGLVVALWWASGVWVRTTAPVWGGTGAAVAATLAAAVAVADIGQRSGHWTLPVSFRGEAFTARVALSKMGTARETIRGVQEFTQRAGEDAFAGRTDLFDRIGDRDVLVIFIESYGRASFDVPFYADTHRAILREAERDLSEVGLDMRSGWLTAPMIGGQSWLSHASLAFGLWIPDQSRYRALLASPRQSLFHLAQASGFHTAAVMPAITFDWPEAERMGFDTVLTATELRYAGKAFNWVTMPDQFTLQALEQGLRQSTPPGAPPPEAPLFAQAALISSHAPWTPVPDLVDWEDVGDGSIFDRMAEAGDPPAVVWQDIDRVRTQYRKAVSYALRTLTSFVVRVSETAPLVVVMGDHQTSARISGSDSYDVPIHVIGPPDALALIADWGWTPGLIPAADTSPWRMDAFRDKFIAAYTSGAAGGSGARFQSLLRE